MSLARPKPSQPLIVAHRGASTEAPENTLPAFQLAWEQGADAVEGDFQLTGDNHIVCIHDSDTARVGRAKRLVRKTRLTDLQLIDVGSWRGDRWTGTPIPTLAQVMDTVPAGKKLYIELKSGPRIVRHLFKQIDRTSLDPQQLVIISFSSRTIRKIKTLRPSLKALWLVTLERAGNGSNLAPSVEKILSTLAINRADGLSVSDHPDVNQEFADTIQSAGFELHVWTVDDPESARRWADLGARSITTNQLPLLKRSLGQAD